jgi:prepilin-type processing-associated H-X9-DG protein
LRLSDYLDYTHSGGAFVCPSWYPNTFLATSGYYYTYGMRAELAGTYRGICYNLFKTEGEAGNFSSSNFLLFSDSIKDTDPNLTQASAFFAQSIHTNKVHARHSRKANSWFADGSVRPCSSDEMVNYGVLQGQTVDYY